MASSVLRPARLLTRPNSKNSRHLRPDRQHPVSFSAASYFNTEHSTDAGAVVDRTSATLAAPHLPALPALPSALSTASHPLSKTFSNPVPTPQSTVPAMSARPSLPSQSSTGSAGRPGFASRPVAHASLQSDRPDSDSEEDDSEDERPLARGRQRGTNGHVNGNGIGNGNGSASGNGGGVPQKKPAGAQKAPRKQAPVKKKHPLAHGQSLCWSAGHLWLVFADRSASLYVDAYSRYGYLGRVCVRLGRLGLSSGPRPQSSSLPAG